MPRAEHHHIVPRSYLERFATDAGELAMYDKSSGKWVDLHASNAAVRSDFYTVDLINEGASDQVEQALGRIEGRMATGLRHLDEGVWPPDEEDRQAFADFIGLQSVRGAEFRDSIQSFYDEVGQKMGDLIAARGAGLRKTFAEEHGRPPTEEEFENLKQSMKGMEIRADIPRNYHVVLMLQMAGEQALMVYAKRLSILTTSDAHFITADVPLSLWAVAAGPFGSMSLMMADEVCLPIDRSRSLVLDHPTDESDRGPEEVIDIDAGRVADINQRIARRAARFVFCHPDDASFAEAALGLGGTPTSSAS